MASVILLIVIKPSLKYHFAVNVVMLSIVSVIILCNILLSVMAKQQGPLTEEEGGSVQLISYTS